MIKIELISKEQDLKEKEEFRKSLDLQFLSKEEEDKQKIIGKELIEHSKLLEKFDRINIKVEQKGKIMGRILENRNINNSGYQGYTSSDWERLNRR